MRARSPLSAVALLLAVLAAGTAPTLAQDGGSGGGGQGGSGGGGGGAGSDGAGQGGQDTGGGDGPGGDTGTGASGSSGTTGDLGTNRNRRSTSDVEDPGGGTSAALPGADADGGTDRALAERLETAYAAYDEAFNSGDADAVAAFYADDAVLLPPTHDVIKGPAAIERFFAGLFAAGVTGHELELIEATGDERDVVAAARWSARSKDGPVGGIATHQFVRQPDGGLEIRLHTFN